MKILKAPSAFLVVILTVSPVVADDASSDWSSTPGFQNANQQAVDYNRAQQMYLAKNGLLGNVTNSYNSQYCEVAGSCQNNDSTNLNGVTVVTVENSSGNITVDTSTSTDNTDQTNSHTAATDIGSLTFN